ncbi:hypothetical protein Tco_1246628 [Tanacetum coccineum]
METGYIFDDFVYRSSIPGSEQSNLVVISLLLSLKFLQFEYETLGVQLPMSIMACMITDLFHDRLSYLLCALCGRERFYLDDSKFLNLSSIGVTDSYSESFLLSQWFEEGDETNLVAKRGDGALGGVGDDMVGDVIEVWFRDASSWAKYGIKN